VDCYPPRMSVAGEKETGRVEAFSDGVFAIAITLLVLEIKVPHVPDGQLFRSLLELWPSYFAYATSFFTVGVMWINHHRMFSHVGRTDGRLLMLNGLLLFGICFVPFPTAVVAAYLGHPGARTAACFLAVVYIGIAIAFNLLWRYASSEDRKPRLLHDRADIAQVRGIRAAYAWGPFMYVATLLISLLDAHAGVAANLALAVYWAIPQRARET
jgi:uncharacterized membrane protein